MGPLGPLGPFGPIYDGTLQVRKAPWAILGQYLQIRKLLGTFWALRAFRPCGSLWAIWALQALLTFGPVDPLGVG